METRSKRLEVKKMTNKKKSKAKTKIRVVEGKLT